MAAQLGGDDDSGPIAGINVVPLVDIILVVLIIFMVTAPIVLKPTIDINLPKASSGDNSAPSLLNITVTKEGTILLNGKNSNIENVTVLASQLVKENPETSAILQADKAVTLEKLTEIIDIVKSAGIKRVAFSIEKK